MQTRISSESGRQPLFTRTNSHRKKRAH